MIISNENIFRPKDVTQTDNDTTMETKKSKEINFDVIIQVISSLSVFCLMKIGLGPNDDSPYKGKSSTYLNDKESEGF